MNFLRALSPAAVDAFTAVAIKQDFVRGSRLMTEGEQADRVMVIIDGWTRVSVGERILAERGPGQLVGERAALRPNFRSATVTALTEVKALVMRTDDFASFIEAHPRVLDVVEHQIYQRLTEGPDGNAKDSWPETVPLQVGGYAPSARRPSQPLTGENCTVLRTDVAGFGARDRSEQDQLIIRRAGLEMMQESLGPLWEACISEDRGDGLLIVVPPHVPTGKIMDRIHRELPDKLWQHNRTYNTHARIHLRIAVNVGPVTSDLLGVSGDVIIRTTRLVDAPAVKAAMAATGHGLGIVVSEFVYETAVGQAGIFIEADEYRKIDVTLKEFNSPAWMRLVRVSPPARDPLGATAPAVPAVRTVAGDLAAGSLLTVPARTGYLASIHGASRATIDRDAAQGT
jgi:hypothetical protein